MSVTWRVKVWKPNTRSAVFTWQRSVCGHVTDRHDESMQTVVVSKTVELGENYGVVGSLPDWKRRERRIKNIVRN